jgi:hypothetical protein
MNKMGKIRQGNVFSFKKNEKLDLTWKDKHIITRSVLIIQEAKIKVKSPLNTQTNFL